ncbi:hypothetical protein LCGC14_0365130 [marine sediment metagenome]|uniref:Uncharacterized protein n=1 Tax=marine sediment metagenome TaxID=412755 RepID=A0A0F9VU77_9ZZZZ
MSRYAGTDLEIGKQYWLDELDKRIERLEIKGIDLANTEKDYRVALAKKILKLNDVRSGTVKVEIAKGTEDIAFKRLQRDIEKVKYDTVQQSIYQSKLELGIIKEDILNERLQR